MNGIGATLTSQTVSAQTRMMQTRKINRRHSAPPAVHTVNSAPPSLYQTPLRRSGPLSWSESISLSLDG